MDDSRDMETHDVGDLLDHSPPEGYIEEWLSELSTPKEVSFVEGQESMLVFRLNSEWFALSTGAVVEIVDSRPVHRVPHRTSPTMRGLTNVRGRLQICVSLHSLLSIMPQKELEKGLSDDEVYPRMIAFGEEGQRWVFEVDEVFGVTMVDNTILQEGPASVTQVDDPYTKGLFDWKNQKVAVLDPEGLNDALLRNIGTA